MAAPKRTPFQREKDLAELASRYLHGEILANIAGGMGVTHQQLSYDLAILRKRWQKSALADINEAKCRELAKVDELERTYWSAWQRSTEDKESTATEKVEGETARLKAQMRREGQSGNPAFLTGVQWCINKRCQILGIDAPVKVAPTNPEGNEQYNAGLGDSGALARVLAILDSVAKG